LRTAKSGGSIFGHAFADPREPRSESASWRLGTSETVRRRVLDSLVLGANSVLLNYLLTLLALIIERLYRIRYLHRGPHKVHSAEQLCRLLWISLSRHSTPSSACMATRLEQWAV
jgi:hypothetical protein